jgi:hypothetical protein
MKNLIHVWVMSVIIFSQLHLFAQLNDITHLPNQNPSQSILESAPVWISENEILIFYVTPTLDTIYSTKSNDRGLTWGEPEFVQLVNRLIFQESIYLTAARSNTGRILLAWSVITESLKLVYSDDFGATWSVPKTILGGGTVPSTLKNSEYLNLTQLETGELVLSFSSSYRAYYRISNDDGINWSEEAINFPLVSIISTKELSINSIGTNSLLSVFYLHLANGKGIYQRISNDGGSTWGDTIRVVNGVFNETRPRIAKDTGGTIWLVYESQYRNGFGNQLQTDLVVLKSTDNGNSWEGEEKFTKYIGEDRNHNISNFNDNVFVSFASERIDNNFHLHYGIINESEDTFTPPQILSANIFDVDLEVKEFKYNAVVVDNDSIKNVFSAFEDSLYIFQLFDDGEHYDENSGDKIYGNLISFQDPKHSNSYFFDINNIKLPLNNRGVLAAVNIRYEINTTVSAYDINDNRSFLNYYGNLGGLGAGGKFEEGTFLFSGGFFLSGYSNGELWSNAVASATLVEDYLPGLVGGDPESSFYNIFAVDKDDTPFGPSWVKWKNAVELGAEFYDGDGDGIYNPNDKNWNGTWDHNEDMPFILGDALTWCVYNDGIPANERRWITVDPQGIEIRQTVFATSIPELENVIFIKYSLLNTGEVTETIDSVYFGIWEDGDLGDFTDDVVGCDTIFKSGYYYNNNQDDVYGENCPAFFTTLLQGPVIRTEENADTAKENYGNLLYLVQVIWKSVHTFFSLVAIRG